MKSGHYAVDPHTHTINSFVLAMIYDMHLCSCTSCSSTFWIDRKKEWSKEYIAYINHLCYTLHIVDMDISI